MNRWLLLPILLLGACGGRPDAAQTCDASSRPFLEGWACMRDIATRDRLNDLGRYVLATGDVAAERVRAGQLTDAEAKMIVAKAQAEARSAYLARIGALYAAGGDGPVTYQRVGPGTVIAY